ncbi:hypothetical protein AAZX31_09G226000 [Glycine max]|uniref:Transcription factor bHLH25 n=1 Tax=Glycine soja TaxID=3848 RepID=A0A445J5P4_GLYSO|nr:transcription factor bHLH25-like [Glycine soja]KAG5013968.1 hypothetical protein JHK86_026229 [Glycine max]KAG5134915.1 hypothetical protein JHK82_026103 [Glycine max]KAH1044646.1 hypothetical protein GYH30_026081 [Glycine max]RZB93713.1 Transcription factor bHLH25 [Glycine soja]
MGDDDFFNNQIHMISFTEEKSSKDMIFQQAFFSSSSSSSSLQSNLKPCSPFPTGGYVLSFDKPVVEPLYPKKHHSPKSLAQSQYCVEPKAFPRTRPRVHILAERKRREELTKSIVALSATIPGLKKTDKVNVVREAVSYVKQLQERVKELENQKRKESMNSIILNKHRPLSINDQATHGFVDVNEELLEVKVTVLDKEVLIGIYCEKQRQRLLKILSLLDNLHLSITHTSVLPFGTSTLKITIIAQMNNEYNMTIDDLVKTLRQRILKSQDMQK